MCPGPWLLALAPDLLTFPGRWGDSVQGSCVPGVLMGWELVSLLFNWAKEECNI